MAGLGMMEAKRVLLCGPSRASVSGVATHLNQLFASSLSKKYKLMQFQVGSEGRGEAGVGKVFRLFSSPIFLLRVLFRFKPDIVHFNTSLDAKAYWRDLIYLFVVKMYGCQIVYQVHGGSLPSQFLGGRGIGDAFLRWSFDIPNVIVLLASIERDDYRAFRAGKRVEVIPNAIDLDDYAELRSKQYGNETLLLGYIGRLSSVKGIKETIEALSVLQSNGLNGWRLRIAGSGPYEDYLQELAKEKTANGTVEFAGPVFGEEKIKFWSDIDVCVLPTYHREGLPYTVLEALAAGAPLLTTRVGGIPDVIREGVEGLFVEPRDPRGLAEAIKSISSDRQKLREMSESALSRAKENYGVGRLAVQFDELYQELSK